MRSRLLAAAVPVVATLAVAPGALAAAPAARTLAPVEITFNGATARAAVDPRGLRTTVFFELGTTTSYGQRSADARTSGSGARTIRIPLGGLRPQTRYHLRVVASNRDGVTAGRDVTFTTRKEPVGFTLSANPNPLRLGASSVIAGALTGTERAGRTLQLQARGFPYTSEFADVPGAFTRSDANGAFAFPPQAPGANTQYRARIGDRPSGVVTIGVEVRVGTLVSATRVRRGRLVRFWGTVRPAKPFAPYAIQKRNRRGDWVTVAGGVVRGAGRGVSRFSRRLRLARGGQFRVYVRATDGNHVAAAGRTIRIRTR